MSSFTLFISVLDLWLEERSETPLYPNDGELLLRLLSLRGGSQFECHCYTLSVNLVHIGPIFFEKKGIR